MELYERALKIAISAHAGQLRKHDNTPYVSHPIMVARLLEQAGFGEVVVVAGLVHDVLEDTSVTEMELRNLLGDQVVDMVIAVSEAKELPWEDRKTAYVTQVLQAGESVWALSVADKIHNARDFVQFHGDVGPDAWKVFNRGKSKKLWFENLLYTELQKVWDHALLEEYAKAINALEQLAD
jgi:(p)ppGpp synthase/HD superfamily hydrolase